MMILLKDIIIPLVVASTIIFVLNKIIYAVLHYIGLDMVIIKMAILLFVWYYIGPIVYKFLLNNLIVYENDIIVFFYTPIQTLKSLLKL